MHACYLLACESFSCKVNEFEIMDCLWEALGSISINHVYSLACKTISEAVQQRWTEEIHYRQLNRVEPPPKPHKYTHTTDVWSSRHQVLIDEKTRDAEWKAPTQPRSPKGRGGSLQLQQQATPTRPSRMVNTIPAGMEGDQPEQINLLNLIQRKSQPPEQQEQPMEPPKSTKGAQSSSKRWKGQVCKYTQLPIQGLTIANQMKHQWPPLPVTIAHPGQKL